MAYNRFHKPIERYVPIPFQELMTVGKELNAQREKAEKDLTDYIKNANEFTSLLSKDVDTYNQVAFNNQIKQYINQAAANPSVMKDAAWRSGMRAAMNAVDYGMLNKLKSSAESAKAYDVIAKKLAMEGKLPPGWEPDYFNTYSTAESGVFNATPLPYQTKTDIVKPYLDNLKDSYLGTEDGYDYYGVDAATIANQLKVFESDILNNPSNQREIQRYVQRGMSLEDATDFVLRQVNTAGLEFMRSTRTINPIHEIDKKAEAAARKAGIGKYGNNTFLFTQSMTADGNLKASNAANYYLQELHKDKFETIQAGMDKNATPEQKAAAEKAKQELQEIRKNTTDAEVRGYLFTGKTGKELKEIKEKANAEKKPYYLSTSEALEGTNLMFQVYPSVLGGDANNKLNNSIQGVSDDYENGKRVIYGQNNLQLAPVAMANVAGVDIDPNSPLVAINDALRSGKLGKIKITGSGGTMSFPTSDRSNSINYGYNNASISEKELLNSNIFQDLLTDEERKKLTEGGLTKKRAKELEKERLRERLSGIGVKIEELHPAQQTIVEKKSGTDNDSGTKKSTVSTTVQEPEITYNFLVMYSLPSTHGGVAAEILNTDMALFGKSKETVGKEHIYNFIMSNH